MNYRVALTTMVLALTLVATRGVIGANQEPEKLTFTMTVCGIGAFSSHQIYSVSDGTTLNVDSEMYMTLEKARKAFARELKAARRITNRQDLLDDAGKKVGERVLFVTRNGTKEQIVWLSLKDKSLDRVEAASLRHIAEFREWETQPAASTQL
jgi:hypothetical protein